VVDTPQATAETHSHNHGTKTKQERKDNRKNCLGTSALADNLSYRSYLQVRTDLIIEIANADEWILRHRQHRRLRTTQLTTQQTTTLRDTTRHDMHDKLIVQTTTNTKRTATTRTNPINSTNQPTDRPTDRPTTTKRTTTTKRPNKPTTNERTNERTNEQTNERRQTNDSDKTIKRTNERTNEQTAIDSE